MTKLTLAACFLLFTSMLYAQDFLVLKKGNKRIYLFQKDDYITVQLKSGEWISGPITRLQNDSFYVWKMVIRYSWSGNDTLHFGIVPLALNDVVAMPRKGEQVVFVNDQLKLTPGDEHWVWVKNGLFFTVVGGGYVVLHTANSLIQKDAPFAHDQTGKLGIGAGVFLLGRILHKTYKPHLQLGNKYHLQTIKISGRKQESDKSAG